MNWFKRLCLFVFGLSGMLSLAALSLVWVGPWTTQARTLISENRYYFITLEALVCITALGLLLCFLSSLFSPRYPKESVIAEVPGGEITVTRTAVVSQVRHILDVDGTCYPASIHVRMHRRGRIHVNVRVRPHVPIDVVERGAVLYEKLEEGLAKVCGESVQSINLVFTEPERDTSAPEVTVEKTPRKAERSSSSASTGAREITVSMSSTDGNVSKQTADTASQEVVQEPAGELAGARESESTAETVSLPAAEETPAENKTPAQEPSPKTDETEV